MPTKKGGDPEQKHKALQDKPIRPEGFSREEGNVTWSPDRKGSNLGEEGRVKTGGKKEEQYKGGSDVLGGFHPMGEGSVTLSPGHKGSREK